MQNIKKKKKTLYYYCYNNIITTTIIVIIMYAFYCNPHCWHAGISGGQKRRVTLGEMAVTPRLVSE
jgi:hypothetical protein